MNEVALELKVINMLLTSCISQIWVLVSASADLFLFCTRTMWSLKSRWKRNQTIWLRSHRHTIILYRCQLPARSSARPKRRETHLKNWVTQSHAKSHKVTRESQKVTKWQKVTKRVTKNHKKSPLPTVRQIRMCAVFDQVKACLTLLTSVRI